MAIVEVDQSPPNIWSNDAFRYALLVSFLLFIIGSCYCSFALRLRRRGAIANGLFISLAERSRTNIPEHPPELMEAWVYGKGKPVWSEMKPLAGERVPDSSLNGTDDRQNPYLPSSSSPNTAAPLLPSGDVQVAVLIAMPSAHPRTSVPDKLDEDLPLDERLGGTLAFGIATLPADTRGL